MSRVPAAEPTARGSAYADRTIAAYRMRARKVIRNWQRNRVPSRFLGRFARRLPRGARVLDYGCGIGKELAWLAKRGLRVEGVEGTLEFLLAARRRNPGAPILHARFEKAPLPEGAYDAVWCNAALVHVPQPVFAAQLGKLRGALKPGGLLGLTLHWGRVRGYLKRDWIPGRYFAAYTLPEVGRLLRGWERIELKVATGDGRRGRWIQALVQKT